MDALHFNSTIDLGDVISLAVLLLGFIGVVKRMGVMEFKVNELWEWKNKLTNHDSH